MTRTQDEKIPSTYTFKNNHPGFEGAADYPCKAEWMKKNGVVSVSGKWLKRNSLINSDMVNEEEYYDTMLTEIGITNLEHGTYGLDVETTTYPGEKGKPDRYDILGGESFKPFTVLIDGSWTKVLPRDHEGFYQKAKDMGY